MPPDSNRRRAAAAAAAVHGSSEAENRVWDPASSSDAEALLRDGSDFSLGVADAGAVVK